MGFCCELQKGCCDCPIRTTVCTALCHYIIHGILIVSFVFSNICYPPLYYVDYMFGGAGAGLIVISFFTAFVVDLKKCQFIRSLSAFFVTLTVLFTVVATFYYVVERWNDVMVTALSKAIRSPLSRDFPDHVWYTIAVVLCISAPILLFYLIYISSFMCNKWKSYLFTTPYQNNLDVTAFAPRIIIPSDTYSSRQYKPYPVQKNDTPQPNN